MKTLKKINAFRRKLTKLLTKNIGNKQIYENYDLVNKEDIKRILICRPNHRLGNQLLITPIVQELIEIFPNSKIDLFVKGNIASVIFKNYDTIDTIISLPKEHFKHIFKYLWGWIQLKQKRYDLVINAIGNSSSGKLSTKFSNSKHKYFGDCNNDSVQNLKNKDHIHIAKCPVYALRNYLSKIGIDINKTKIPSLDIKLSDLEIAEGKKLLKELVNNDKKTICLFTYATGDKCYSETWWLELYEALTVKYTNYNIIEILPVENISKINFKSPNFYSKDIRQICSFIANTDVFVGADSGMMHLASASLTPTIGLFSITNTEVYQPYYNKNIGINTNSMNTNEIIEIIENVLSK
jgi:heptosyltransferase-3